MDKIQKIRRVGPMMVHQPGQRRAVIMEKAFLDFSCFDQITLKSLSDIFAHPDINQRKQIALDWIEHVIEIKNPVIDMGEFWWHVAIA
jgi:hypothetical protein